MLGTNQKPRALLAAANRVKLDRFKKVGETWQEPLWDIYRDLGPVHYGMTFKRSAAMRVNYFVAEITEETDEPTLTENKRAIEALERLGDVSTIVGDLVVQTNVAGEGYLNGSEAGEDEDEPDKFVVLSTLEVNARHRDEKNPLGEYLLRLWNQAPWNRSEADSPLRSVQAQCEQLLLLNDEIGATSMSRVPAGFLMVPDELSFGTNAEDYPDDGANADGDPFMAEVIQIVSKAITDADSAARVAPNVIRGPAEYLDKFRYVDISRKMDEVFAGMREELLRQIAGGINLPAEILTGLADLNHWSLWGVDESTAKHHVDPDVLAILQGLTEGYLWPFLEEGGMSRDEARRFMIWRDYSDLTARPMTVEQALELNREGIITDEYVRRIANVPEDMAGDGRPSDSPQSDEDPRAMREPPENIAAAAAINTRPLQEIDRRVATQVIEASEAAFNRALERAGVRVRNKARKDRQMTAAIDGVEDFAVTRTLGWKRIEQLQLTMDQLLPEGEFDQLERRVNQLLAEGQEDTREFLSQTFGEEVPAMADEEEDRITATEAFIAALFAIAGTRLFTDSPSTDPAETGEISDEIATGQMVVDLLTQAGGGSPSPDAPRGLALGQRTRAAFRDRGYRVEALTWQWGYYRRPNTPFEPHLSLDGATVLDREDPRLNGRYPGDHRFCTCELVPAILPATNEEE